MPSLIAAMNNSPQTEGRDGDRAGGRPYPEFGMANRAWRVSLMTRFVSHYDHPRCPRANSFRRSRGRWHEGVSETARCHRAGVPRIRPAADDDVRPWNPEEMGPRLRCRRPMPLKVQKRLAVLAQWPPWPGCYGFFPV